MIKTVVTGVMEVVITTDMTTSINTSKYGVKGRDIIIAGIEYCNIIVSLSINMSNFFQVRSPRVGHFTK